MNTDKNKPKETQHTDFLSDCCNEAYYSRCADEGTCHAVCVQCEKPCNLIKSGAFDKPNNKVGEMTKKVLDYIFSLESQALSEYGRIPTPKKAVEKWVNELLTSSYEQGYEQGKADAKLSTE